MKLSSSLFSTLFISALLFSLAEVSLSAKDFEVFRIIAYEDNSQTFGSKINAFNLQGVHFTGEVLRKLAIIHFSEINDENIVSLLGKKIAGLLIILPNAIDAEKENGIWRNIQDHIISIGSSLPVFFIWENEEILDFYKKTEPSQFGNARLDSNHILNFVQNGPEPRLVKPLQLEDFIGVLDPNAPLNKLTTTSNPVIAVVANYDSFSHVPGARIGVAQSVSGGIVLLNAAKILSEYFELNNNAGYNIMFYLTGEKHGGFEGLQTWLAKAESSKVVSKIDYALLLDDLSSNELSFSLHNLDESTQDRVFQIAQDLKRVAQLQNTKTEIVNSDKILFGRKFPVIQVSTRNSLSNSAVRHWINGRTFNRKTLESNILLVSEFLVRNLYNISVDYQIIDNQSINSRYLDNLVNLFESKSTFPLQITKDSPVTQEIYRAFKDVTQHTGRAAYNYANLQLYTIETGGMKMIKTASAFFDLYLLVANLGWLSLIYFVLNKSSGAAVPEKTKLDSKKKN